MYEMKPIFLFFSCFVSPFVRSQSQETGLRGNDFLQGIKDIIGKDPNVSPSEVQVKPFVGSFCNVNPNDSLENVSYCMTDNACGHFEAYSQKDVPLYLLACNQFCFIDLTTRMFQTSQWFTIESPPPYYLNCGWETCG